MYKTTYELEAYIIGLQDSALLTDSDPTPGAATAALAQVKACRDIDTVMAGGEGAPAEVFHIIIPYRAIDYITVTPTRTEVEDPTDDTCITDDDEEGDGGDTGTLTIIALDGVTEDEERAILASAKLDGQYGPLTFSSDPGGNTFPDGYQSFAILPAMSDDESIEVTGLPVGTIIWDSYSEDNTATVPGTLTLVTET